MTLAREDVYTKATERCPHPEYWSSEDADSTELEVAALVYGLVRGLQPDYCVETGTAHGAVTAKIVQALLENEHGRLTTIEIDGERWSAAAARFEDARYVVDVQFGSSLDWTPPETIDFAWIDSALDWRIRIAEFERYLPYMRRGAVACFHDTAPEHGGSSLRDADYMSVLAKALRGRARLVHLPTPRGLSIAEIL